MTTHPTIEILDNVGPGRQTWLDFWTLCGREPFAHPDYIRLLGSSEDRPRLLVAHGKGGIEILPIALRSLDGQAWMNDSNLYDAVSPYGYGGPYAEGTPEYGTWQGLFQFLYEQDVVAWFGRLALGAQVASNSAGVSTEDANPPPFGDRNHGTTVIESKADNVVVNLQHSYSEQWRRYAPKVRKNVNKALRAGLRVDVGTAFNDLEEFVALYAATMDRQNASAWYRFDLAFFTGLTTSLPANYLAAEVRDVAGRLISAELVLISDNRAYSFLGGTYPDAFLFAPNDLLKHAVINHVRQLGYIEYVLGGGLTAQDGIFRFKRAFAPSGVVPFHLVKMVLDNPNYLRLIDQRSRFEQARLPNSVQRGDFFPAYRGMWESPGVVE